MSGLLFVNNDDTVKTMSDMQLRKVHAKRAVVCLSIGVTVESLSRSILSCLVWYNYSLTDLFKKCLVDARLNILWSEGLNETTFWILLQLEGNSARS